MNKRLIHKAVACVIRKNNDTYDLLSFKHSVAGYQVPKGTVEQGEPIEIAVLRELKEESGISEVKIIDKIGCFDREVGAGPNEDGPLETHKWHLFLMQADIELPNQWEHKASGSREEEGLTFQYFWFPLSHENSSDGFFFKLCAIMFTCGLTHGHLLEK